MGIISKQKAFQKEVNSPWYKFKKFMQLQVKPLFMWVIWKLIPPISKIVLFIQNKVPKFITRTIWEIIKFYILSKILL